jgi:hypothetical protein
MSTLIGLAQQIETTYTLDTPNSVKVCRPDLGLSMDGTNLPYTQVVSSNLDSGVETGSLYVKAQTSSAGAFTILQVGYIMNLGDSSSYSLSVDGDKALQDYKRGFRPLDPEYDSLWLTVVDHFSTVRNLIFITRLDVIAPATPVTGKITGFHLIGDGVTDVAASNEYWLFEASYPWGTPGNIKSWKYSG